MNKQKQIRKKLTASVVTMVILAFGLCITTFALVYSIVTVDNNRFQTGTVKINLNGGKPVIEDHEFLFEPGMTVEKGLRTKAHGTCITGFTSRMWKAGSPRCWTSPFVTAIPSYTVGKRPI